MASSPDRAAWEELSRLVHEELAAWRTAHPRAMLADIEAAVGAATRRLQARYLADQVGGRLVARGRHDRAVLVPGQAEPLHLARSYAVCAACRAGHFPPG